MAETKSYKCEHPICTCLITSGKYCSAQCEAVEKRADIECACNHAVCKGRTDSV